MTTPVPAPRARAHGLLAALLSPRTASLPANCALVAARIALAWIFIYHGSGKLFGWFNKGVQRATSGYVGSVAYLMSDAARNITGTVITVDAGNTA